MVRVGSDVGDDHFHMSEKVWSDKEDCAHKPLLLHLFHDNGLILARMKLKILLSSFILF